MSDIKTLGDVSFDTMYDGSYYTIIGCGGSLQEWVDGYNKLLQENGIGTPRFWVTFTGKDINDYYNFQGDNRFQDNINFLTFPLEGMNTGKLAMFKLRMEDRWFDDLVDNSTRKGYESSGEYDEY